MSGDHLKDYYNRTSSRFWEPVTGPAGRDLVVYPLLNGLRGSLLEYGCGSGSLLLHLAQEERFQQVCGVDISDKALNKIEGAWRQLAPTAINKLRLCQPQADFLPFIDDGAVDVIVSVATIEHVLNPYVVLDELHRIASPAATLVCSVPNLGYIKHRIRLLMGKLPQTGTEELVTNWRRAGWDGMHLHSFTQNSFSILLSDCGWNPVRWTGWGERCSWLGNLRRRYPGLFSGELIATCKKVLADDEAEYHLQDW